MNIACLSYWVSREENKDTSWTVSAQSHLFFAVCPLPSSLSNGPRLGIVGSYVRVSFCLWVRISCVNRQSPAFFLWQRRSRLAGYRHNHTGLYWRVSNFRLLGSLPRGRSDTGRVWVLPGRLGPDAFQFLYQSGRGPETAGVQFWKHSQSWEHT